MGVIALPQANCDLPVNLPRPIRRGIALAICSASLVIAATLVVACGGNSANSGPVAASLEGEQKEVPDDTPIPTAPTEVHGTLARLLPKAARLNDTISYCGWDADHATAFTDKDLGEGAVKKAPMPCVRARFSSTGYELIGVPGEKGDDSMMAQTYPQVCDFYLIETPAPDAALAVCRKINEQLTAQKFEKKDPLNIGSKLNQNPLLIDQFLRVDQGKEHDSAFVGYTLVIGNRVLYALETEIRKPAVGPGGETFRLPSNMQMGSRVGGQLILLVEDAINR